MSDATDPKGETIPTDQAGDLATDAPRPSRLRSILIVVLILAAAGGFFAWRYFSARESTDDAQIEGHVHPIAARVGGTVINLAVQDNQWVEAGAVLAQLDPKDYQVALDRARADLAEAEAALAGSQTDVPITSTNTSSVLTQSVAGVAESEASLTTTERTIAMAKARLDSARATVQQIQANYDRAAKDVERFRTLVAKEEVSQQQFDAAVAQADALKASLAAAQAQVVEAEANVRTQESSLNRDRAKLNQSVAAEQRAHTGPQQVAVAKSRAKSAEARVEIAKAAVAQAELNLQYTTIKAPVAGTVSNRSVELGQIIGPGQPLMAVIPTDDIWVVANFKETQLHKMKPGQKVAIAVDVDGREYEGHVDSLAGATGARFSLLPPENATGNFVKVVQRVPVKIVFEPGQDKEHRLRPGLSVEPSVYIR
ncbi:MAG: HlyD family secretion protein [Bryobacteraceae bacterium]|nr:HlyD family secretion protein [Bryobacteraceae bacterium]